MANRIELLSIMQTFSDELFDFYLIAFNIISYPAYICGTITN